VPGGAIMLHSFIVMQVPPVLVLVGEPPLLMVGPW
jgi:hypothetical protein